MTFLNWAMLLAMAAVAAPIIIHLLNRRQKRLVPWGAMQFLLASATSRSRHVLIEEILLLVVRCLLVMALALAMARPFVPATSALPWGLLLPAVMLATASVAVAAALWRRPRWRWGLLGAAGAILSATAAVVALENTLQTRRWASRGGGQDVAIVLDASTSMTVGVGGRQQFEHALDEARAIVDSLGPADSASILLGGSLTREVTPGPISDRKELRAHLDRLACGRGAMRLSEAVRAAGEALARGANPGKVIVVVSDGQASSWDLEAQDQWRQTRATLDKLPTRAALLLRTLETPATLNNLAVADIRLSRPVVGTDRPLAIEAHIRNTGTAALTPDGVELLVDDKSLGRQELSRVEPGAAQVVRFFHRFDAPGPHVLRVRLDQADDLPADNSLVRAVQVVDRLAVLIVNGSPSADPLADAGAFVELALSPPEDSPDARTGPTGSLVEPTVVTAADLARMDDLMDYQAIVLSGVSELPGATADKVAGFVRAGGGLVVLAGPRCRAAFYNEWRCPIGQRVMPAPLAQWQVQGQAGWTLAVSSLTHPALRALTDAGQNDLDAARLRGAWTLDGAAGETPLQVCLATSEGRPVVVEHRLGRGRVMLSAVPLDARWSNLPTLKSFVPLVHELTYFAAMGATVELNLPPAASLALDLPLGEAALPGRGLTGQYYRDTALDDRCLVRLDSRIDFDWQEREAASQVPADNFSVRWTGKVVPQFSELYTFSTVSDDGVRLWVDGRKIIDNWSSHAAAEDSGTIPLRAGRSVTICLEYFDASGMAQARLSWQSRSQRKEVVPASQLLPDPKPWRGARRMERASSPLAQPSLQQSLEVLGPNEQVHEGTLTLSGLGARLVVHNRGACDSGLYRAKIPPQAVQGGLAAGGEGVLPFVVETDPNESVLTPAPSGDTQRLGPYLEVFEAGRLEDLLMVLGGRAPGQELWRLLAAAALALVVLEVALTRWIARRRKEGQGGVVRFGDQSPGVESFRMRARELLDAREGPGQS